jgi:hypothetical protein
MEYYLQTSLGLITITPREGLPSAVELRIAGKTWAAYLSAEDAAVAVASSSTGHAQLDALPSNRVPALLSDWKPSLPLHFITGALRSETPEQLALAEHLRDPQLEAGFIF